jgi:hypothetical protein
VRVGETLIVGDTALVLTMTEDEAASTGARSTEVTALLSGLAADVRGLAQAVNLLDRLDGAEDEPGVREALDAWAKGGAGAQGATLLTGDAIDAELDAAKGTARVVERPGPGDSGGSVVLAAPAHTAVPAWIAVTFGSSASLTDPARRDPKGRTTEANAKSTFGCAGEQATKVSVFRSSATSSPSARP